mmetsp:Transcript_22572/g.40016  ORF Transcript_22572/g.40016 Transcript_22572/m.40016 type:complete len:382 (-) Transcript_22572:137-1282(-)
MDAQSDRDAQGSEALARVASAVESTDESSPLRGSVESDRGTDESEEDGEDQLAVESWYEKTFSSELSEVEKSMKRSSRLSGVSASSIGLYESRDEVASIGACGSDADDIEDMESSASAHMAKMFEIALLQANQKVDAQKQTNEYLETRLECLEEVEELRNKLSSIEVELLLQLTQQTNTTGSERMWDKDEDHLQCWHCASAFSLINRRHHCRNCGHIFCFECCPRWNVAPIPHLGFTEPVRHCIECLSRGTEDYEGSENAGLSGSSSAMDHDQGLTVSHHNKQPFTKVVDKVRRLESACLREPSSDNLVSAMEAYVQAVEKISKAEVLDAHLRKTARSTLLRSMQALLQMPKVQAMMDSDSSSTRVSAVVQSLGPDALADE